MAELKRSHIKPGDVSAGGRAHNEPLVEGPQDLLVIAAGGRAGVQSAFIPGWGGKTGSQSVTQGDTPVAVERRNGYGNIGPGRTARACSNDDALHVTITSPTGGIMPIQIFDPTTEATQRRINYAPRPKSLDGLRIGLVDNTKHNSDQLLLRIAGHTREASTAPRRTSSAERRARARRRTRRSSRRYKADCDVIVAGVGD